MKLSTKGRYGLRAMIDLAVNSNGDQVSLYSIAERQNISESYLEQVFSAVRKAGLIKSVKGAQGGYLLADRPENITVGSILRALEGELTVIDEKAEPEMSNINSIQYCIRKNVWDKIDEIVNEFVDSITLEDLVEDYRKMSRTETIMYYI